MFDLVHAEKGMVAAALTLFTLWLLQPVAFHFKFLDMPGGRKDHERATPITGGVAMAIGVLLTITAMSEALSPAFVGFATGSVLLLVVGILDDKYDLPWYLRILVQVSAALCMVYIGGVQIQHLGPVFGLGEMSLGGLSVPFTVFATVGLINAINMVDGVDGLAGLLGGIAMVMLLAGALYSGNVPVAQMALVQVGSIAAFLTFNMRFPWQPAAKVFMGNAGSAFLGFSIAWITFSLTQNTAHPVSPILALWFVPIPVMDTLVLMVRRLRNGRSPFHGDRNHIHHLMLEGGFGPTQAGWALALFTGLCGLAAGQALRLDIPHPYLLFAFVGMCVAWYWATACRSRTMKLFGTLRTLGTESIPAGQPEVAADANPARARSSGSGAWEAVPPRVLSSAPITVPAMTVPAMGTHPGQVLSFPALAWDAKGTWDANSAHGLAMNPATAMAVQHEATALDAAQRS